MPFFLASLRSAIASQSSLIRVPWTAGGFLGAAVTRTFASKKVRPRDARTLSLVATIVGR
jgi:hypothetical protein